MILFKSFHVPLILTRQKTETRRVWSHGCRVKVGSVHQAKTSLFAKEYFAELRILKVWKQRLGEMTSQNAKAEGYRTVAEYKKIWEEINGSWNDGQEVWAVRFKILDQLEGGHNCLECGGRIKVIRVEPYDGIHDPTGIWLSAGNMSEGNDKTIGCLCNTCADDLCKKGIIFEGCVAHGGRLYVDGVVDNASWHPKHPEFLINQEDDENEDEEDPLEF